MNIISIAAGCVLAFALLPAYAQTPRFKPLVESEIGLTGYYTMLAMVLNVAQQPLPGGVPPPLPALK